MTYDRIAGGKTALSPIPWQVSVRAGTSGSAHWCGGTILDENTIMSSASCFNKCHNMDGFFVMAGATDKNSSSGQVNFLKNINIFL